MIRRSQSLALVAGMLALACGGSTSGDGGGTGTCVHDGKTYQIGESYPADCNSCTCTEQGFACTAMACPACTYGGQSYFPGDSFPAGDGCNTCTCSSDGSVGCTLMACPTGCVYEGKPYQPGETFPAGDGCNSCTCNSDGTVACTKMACPAGCVYAGKTYAPGDTFPALDGCNKCSCNPDTTISCTEISCPCDPDKEWWREYVSKDPQQCMVIDYECIENTTSFYNACGCGCEQDPSCPQYFDCMPPANCDVDALKKKCPYSGVAF